MKMHKILKTDRKAQANQPGQANIVQTKGAYTVRTMFNDLSKWESFIKLTEIK